MFEKKWFKFLKKIAVVGLIVSSIGVVVPQTARAGFTDSSLFEPMLGCVAGGVAGYVTASRGQEFLMAAAFCGGGALVGVLLNMHYSSKYDKVYRQDIAELRRSNKEMQLQQAFRASTNEDESYSIRVRKVVPGQKLPNGSVTAPTIVETLVTPGETVRVGD